MHTCTYVKTKKDGCALLYCSLTYYTETKCLTKLEPK